MRIGILDAVPPEFKHVDENISDAEKFIDLLAAVETKAELVVYNVGAGEFPEQLDSCDGYLIKGSPASVYDDEAWIHDLKEFICAAHAAQKRLVGICFGHQLIAEALGGEVKKSPDGWLLGLLDFKVLETPAWMESAVPSTKLYHINKDQVMTLPQGARRIGQSAACENSMYTIGDHILCIQGHPEQPLRAMNNFIEDLGAEVPVDTVQRARETFSAAKPDDLLVGRWLRHFFERTGF